MPRKIVINTSYGGFSLSKIVKNQYREAISLEKEATEPLWHMETQVARDDPLLIQIIESIGLGSAGGKASVLKIVEIPDDVPGDGWMIMEYDGAEWVAEKHRTWA